MDIRTIKAHKDARVSRLVLALAAMREYSNAAATVSSLYAGESAAESFPVAKMEALAGMAHLVLTDTLTDKDRLMLDEVSTQLNDCANTRADYRINRAWDN